MEGVAGTSKDTGSPPVPSSNNHSVSSPTTSAQPGLPSAIMSDPPSPPMRGIVSSASELPSKEVKAAVFSQHVASEQYIDYHRKAMEALRESHRQERAAWNFERQELHNKLAELESKIKRLHSVAIDGSAISSIDDKLSNYTFVGGRLAARSASTPGDFASTSATRHQSISSSADEGISKGKARMESIAEEGDDRNKSVSFAAGAVSDKDINKALGGFTIPGHLIDRDLDGISIKATGLPASTKKALLEDSKSGTPSPLFTPSPRNEAVSPGLKRPVTIEIPSTQQILQMPAKDIYTYAAGNTPLARMTGDEENVDTGSATPKIGVPVTIENERPPLEPHPSTLDTNKPMRPPNERSDSYFNVPIPDNENKVPEPNKTGAEAQADEDPALAGPLSMPSGPSAPGNNDFLDKLDQKLTSLSRQQSRADMTSPDQQQQQQQQQDSAGGMGDPPLRIRRSINFGSQLGQGPR